MHPFRTCVLKKTFTLVSAFFSTQSHGFRTGGGERDRTDDLLRARQALSQLSYTPILNGGPRWT